MHETQKQGIAGVTLDDIYLGNGASELIAMATNALLNDGDELLLPAPDYPLWTAVASRCRAARRCTTCATRTTAGCRASTTSAPRSRRAPRASWSSTRTTRPARCTPNELLKGIVAIAREHGLVIFADEVYDKVLYDGVKHTAIASLSTDVLTLTFNSLSKSYRSLRLPRRLARGVGRQEHGAQDYIEGLNMLSNMRLCANVPGQWAIQTALGGYQSINDLVCQGGRLRRQRDLAYELITAIPGVSCVKPQRSALHVPQARPRGLSDRGRPRSSSSSC